MVYPGYVQGCVYGYMHVGTGTEPGTWAFSVCFSTAVYTRAQRCIPGHSGVYPGTAVYTRAQRCITASLLYLCYLSSKAN